VVVLGIIGVLFLILPGPVGVVLPQPHVRATCEARDPVVRWTDACPLPVLGIEPPSRLWSGSHGVDAPNLSRVMPFFGILISGLPGGTLTLALIAVWAYCAWAIYHLKADGWWDRRDRVWSAHRIGATDICRRSI